MNIPNGFFRCKNLAGKISLGFHCSVCKIVVYRGIADPRGIWHCGSFEKPPMKIERLPVYKIQPPTAHGMVGDFGAVSGVLVGFD